MILNNWKTVRRTANEYCAPETGVLALSGEVIGHSCFGEDDSITTSAVRSVKGLTVTTQSGSQYTLGTIDPEFEEFMVANYPEWDIDNPLAHLED
jgi:hypothetical protein